MVDGDSRREEVITIEVTHVEFAPRLSGKAQLLLARGGGLFAAVQFSAAIRPVEAALRPTDHFPPGRGFESAGTFNAAAIEKAGKIVLLYRAQDRQGTSSARLRRQSKTAYISSVGPNRFFAPRRPTKAAVERRSAHRQDRTYVLPDLYGI